MKVDSQIDHTLLGIMIGAGFVLIYVAVRVFVFDVG